MHSTSFHLSRITYVFLGIIAGVFIGTTIRFVFAEVTWKAPQAGTIPPANNVDAPLNVSDTPQYKSGPLGVNTDANPNEGFGLAVEGDAAIGGGLSANGLIKTMGRIQIGNTTDNICDTDIEGTQRYNKETKVMEYCDGEGWKGVGGSGNGNWEDISNDTNYFRTDCLYRWRINSNEAGYNNAYFYPTMVRWDVMSMDWSAGNFTAVYYGNKKQSTGDYSFSNVSTYRLCEGSGG